MKRIIKIGFPIICIAVIGGTFILLNKTTEKINRNKLVETEEEETNEIVEEPAQTNEIANNTTTVPVSSEEAKSKEISNKANAIEIVKRLAPPLTNVYYTSEGTENNLYIVAIRDNDTKIPKIIYSVDIENEKIEVYSK